MIDAASDLLAQASLSPSIANLDHCVISCNLAFNFINNKNYSSKIRDYENGNYEGLNATLHNNMDTNIFNEPNIDVIVEKCNTLL